MGNEHRHREVIFIEGEGFIPPVPDSNRTFRFCRRFEKNESQPETAALIELGKAMKASKREESAIPSGYVYLAQFVNHDITVNLSKSGESEQGQFPGLDLDSVYGRGPKLSKEFYYDGIRLKLGETTKRGRFGVAQKFNNDLPCRKADDDRQAPKQALIGNPLNDENLILAQTHVAFLKFHNKVADYLGANEEERFEEVRKTVVLHYQSIVLHDLLDKAIDESVYQEVVKEGRRRFFCPNQPGSQNEEKRLALPVEFAFAAFRFGHSMVRDTYNWNRVFSSQGAAWYGASLYTLFKLTALSGDLEEFPTLPSDWVVDWRRFYHFGNGKEKDNRLLNRASLIDTNVAHQLHHLPRVVQAEEEYLRSLPVRDLLKGREVRLPTGQAVANEMAKQVKIDVLSEKQIAFDSPSDKSIEEQLETLVQKQRTDELTSQERQAIILQKHKLLNQTPLWYYILREAKIQQHGNRLGQVGSYIVAETLHALIESSRYSILRKENGKWTSTLPTSHGTGQFTMVDLLRFVNGERETNKTISGEKQEEKVDEINPLRNESPTADRCRCDSCRRAFDSMK